MKQTSKAYAEALFSIAIEQNKVAEYADHLEEIEHLLTENPEYVDFLATPALPLSERLCAIEDAFSKSMPEEIVSYLKLLCENGHISVLKNSIQEFFKLEMAVSNTVTVTITSTVMLTEEQKEKLLQKLEAKYRKQMNPIYRTDPHLLGGIRIEMEDQIIDGSVSKRLQSLKEVIKL